MRVPFVAGAGLLLLIEGPVGAQRVSDPVAAGFRNVPPSARMRMFWRIFGPAWERNEISYELEEMQRVGIGGVMTCFTYPVALDDPANGIKNDRFLSPEFLSDLGFAAAKSKELGLRFGVAGGTGWPFGGPSVTAMEAAQRLRRIECRPLPAGAGYALPKLRAGESIVGVFIGHADVTASVRGDQVVTPTPGTAQAFLAGPTFMQVKRPSLGAEGYVVDHLNREAARRYLEATVAPMLRAAPDIGEVFCDSLEVYGENWTHDFPEQFRRRRGYDLKPHLPDLFDAASPASHDLRFDYWRTVAELAEEEFARTVYDWTRRHKVQFALEAYGTPSMGFTAAQYCDVPWGEQYEWRGFSFSRFASSGAHLAGKRIIGAEAWTWTGIPNRLADTLSDLKLCSDLHFLAGENDLVGVDFPYSPRSVGVPGWTPYYGPILGPNNPQWLCFPDFTAYVNRCQWLLRQGDPIADIALYVPTEDVFAHANTAQVALDFELRDRFVSGKPTDEFGLEKARQHRSDLIATLLQQGYNFDGVDCFAVERLAKVQDGQLQAGSGRYRVLILPNIEGMRLPALEKIARFCREGGTVIATRRLPERAWGEGGADTARLQALVAVMFPPGARQTEAGHAFGRGRTFYTPDETTGLETVLARGAVAPDLRALPVQAEVSHVHRRVGRRDFFFVANVGETATTFLADFRMADRRVELWDPMNGTRTPLAATHRNGRTQATLSLPARASVFVCLSPGAQRTAAAVASSISSSPVPIATRWSVTFHGPDAPPPYETETLSSWTEWPGARFFSGQAVYAADFNLPSRPVYPLVLGLDGVHEVAEVRVNGQLAGAVWTPPYTLDITRFVQAGANRLEITVANLPVNRVLGLPDPDLGALRAVYGNRFPDPQEKQLMRAPAPSGLIGKVTLTRSEAP